MRKTFCLVTLSISFLLFFSCEPKMPKVATTVQGTVIDANNNPLEGITVDFSGGKTSGDNIL